MPELVLEHVNEPEHIVDLDHVPHLDLGQVLLHSYVLGLLSISLSLSLT